jgi:hypothetical protein
MLSTNRWSAPTLLVEGWEALRRRSYHALWTLCARRRSQNASARAGCLFLALLSTWLARHTIDEFDGSRCGSSKKSSEKESVAIRLLVAARNDPRKWRRQMHTLVEATCLLQ